MTQALAHADVLVVTLEASPRLVLPRSPVFGWDNLRFTQRVDVPTIADLPHRAYTTSGRAALYAALLQMNLPPRAGVLVPTYHCPTMVAPIVEAGLTPVFYPLGPDGLPELSRFGEVLGGRRPGALFVAHYFGLTQSLHATRRWCDDNSVLMVEDCAHAYFGQAGDRPVGQWGDYATASLSKFFPVQEAGMLASAHHPLKPLGLQRPGLRAQIKSAWDIVDLGCQHGRLRGLSTLLHPLRSARGRPQAANSRSTQDAISDAAIMECDMGRKHLDASLAARWLHAALPAGRPVRRRRQNYAMLATQLGERLDARVLAPRPPERCVPYVLPLWIADPGLADRTYARLRQQQLPVFRWDRVWPGTPRWASDTGRLWNRQVLQLLCHQDLSPADIRHVIDSVDAALMAGSQPRDGALP